MLGILTGMKITLRHFFGRKVTRLYPYQKRTMPPRMRGLIQYLVDASGQFKCEGCLFCEKICPPQAINVTYRQRETHRERALTLPQAVWGNFRRSRRSLLSHQGRPELSLAQCQPGPGEPAIRWDRVAGLLEGHERAANGLAAALGEIQSTVGYLPRHAVTRLATEAGVDVSRAYELATGSPGFRTSPVEVPEVAVCRCPVCRNAGGREVAAAVGAEIGDNGAHFETSQRGRCLGDARQAPVLRVNGRVYGGVTAEAAKQIVREFITTGGPPR